MVKIIFQQLAIEAVGNLRHHIRVGNNRHAAVDNALLFALFVIHLRVILAD